MIDFASTAAELRRKRYRQADDAGKLQSLNEARAFLDEVGFCLLSRRDPIELPNLAQISSGSVRQWKDELLTSHRIYYGRPFRHRLGFIRLDLLPHIYALTPTADFDGNRFELYKRRYLSADANRIAGIVMAKGPLTTRELRRAAGMAGKAHRYRFLRAVIEAESRYLIAKSGISNVGVSHYSYLWTSFPSLFPSEVAFSEKLGIGAAGSKVITSYLDVVVAATVQQVAATFTLNRHFVGYVVAEMEEAGQVIRYNENGEDFIANADTGFVF